MIELAMKLAANKWVRWAALGVVLLLVGLALKQHYLNVGEARGEAKQSQRSAVANAGAVQSDRESTVPQITVLTQQITLLQQQMATQQQLITSIALQRQQLPAQINSLTTGQVEEIIAKHLGKKPGEPDTVQDRREFAKCFQDLDLCNSQVKELEKKNSQAESAIDKSEHKYDLLAGYATRLERSYTDLWNDKSEPQRSWKCLRMWHCSRPQLKTPDPKDLLQRPSEQ